MAQVNIEDPAAATASNPYQTVLKKHRAAVSIKTPWLSLFQECFDYTMPLREAPYGMTPGDDNMEHIFDETGMVGVEEFVSRLKDGMMPAFQVFSQLTAGTDTPPEERENVNVLLDEVTEFVFETINESNFHTEVIEAMFDMSVSVGTLAVYENDPTEVTPFYCQALPMAHMNFRDGPFGKIGFWSRVRTLQCGEIKIAYPDAKLSTGLSRLIREDEMKDVELIECIYQDYTKEVETFKYYLLFEPDQAILLEDEWVGIGSNSWISFRWHKLAGETWARGPVIKALPSIRTANLVTQMTLENAEIAMSGIYTAEDDGTLNVNNVRLLAGTIVPVSPGSAGLRAINGAGNFDVSELVLNELRNNIRKALYNEVLGAPTGTPMSAREVSERMQELYRIAGPNFVRLISELIDPFIKRVIFILRKRGLIDLPAVNGREVSIKADSPLANSQDQNDVVSFGHFSELVGAAYGPEALMMATKKDDVIPWLAQKLSFPGKFIRSEEEQAAMMREMQAGQNEQTTDDQNAGEEAGGNVLPLPTG